MHAKFGDHPDCLAAGVLSFGSDALVSKENRPARVEFDQNSNEQQHGNEQEQDHAGEAHVQPTFAEKIGPIRVGLKQRPDAWLLPVGGNRSRPF